MEKDEQIQEKYLHLQIIAQTLKQVQQQLSLIDQQLSDIERVRDGLADVGKAPAGAKVLVPLSEGIFAHATLAEPGELLVNVGSNVIVKKGIEETRELLAKRKAELAGSREEMNNQMGELMDAAQALQKELNELITT